MSNRNTPARSATSARHGHSAPRQPRRRIERARMYDAAQVAAVTGQKASTVRWQIWDKSVTRCAWDGFEKEGGPAVLGAEYLGRARGVSYTNHQRRNMLRRAGELPPARKAAA